MKKFLLVLLAIILVVLLVAGFLLFTKPGNNILKPYIQTQIDNYSPIPLTLDTFTLRFGSFDFALSSENLLNIDMDGTFSLFSQNIDSMLVISIKNPLQEGASNFVIENAIRGKFTNLTINTISNVANGQIRADTSIVSFSPTKIIASITNVDVGLLLETVGQKPYAGGIFSLSADIDGENLEFSGDLTSGISNGTIDTKLIKQDFNITAPSTTFVINLNGNFNGSDVVHKFEFLSNIGNITSDGTTKIADLKTNSTYDVKISDLSPLTPFVGRSVRGSFNTSGTVVGNSTFLNVEGKSDIASSTTTYSLSTQEYSNLKDVVISIKNLKIEDVLYMLAMPTYATGKLNLDASFKDITSGISGNANYTLSGNASKKVVSQEFDITLPSNLAFTHASDVAFSNGSGVLNSNINTDLAKLDVKNALIVIDSLSLDVPYTFSVSDLKKLVFITSKELKGSIVATGDVKYASGNLSATLDSDLIGGHVAATLNNNIFNAVIKNANTTALLDMLQYPQFFSSNVNGNVKYDIGTSSGTMELIADNGAFVQNKLTNLLKTALSFDATKEVYNNISIGGSINKKVINANLNMSSSNTSLSSENAKIDLEKDTINMYLSLVINKTELGASITGKPSSPSVSLDTKKLGQAVVNKLLGNEKTQETTQKVQEQVQEVTDKVQEQVQEQVDNLKDSVSNKLKNLLSK